MSVSIGVALTYEMRRWVVAIQATLVCVTDTPKRIEHAKWFSTRF